MTNMERVQSMSAEELADTLRGWLTMCSINCPALVVCRTGMFCRQAFITWLTVGRGRRKMTNLERVQSMPAEEFAVLLERWIVKCSGTCPALAECRNGMGCRQAILTWLTREEDNEQSKRDKIPAGQGDGKTASVFQRAQPLADRG